MAVPARIVHRCASQLGHAPLSRGLGRHLATQARAGHAREVEEDEPIYREELHAITFLLADIKVAVLEILSYIKGDDEEEAEEDDVPDS